MIAFRTFQLGFFSFQFSIQVLVFIYFLLLTKNIDNSAFIFSQPIFRINFIYYIL